MNDFDVTFGALSKRYHILLTNLALFSQQIYQIDIFIDVLKVSRVRLLPSKSSHCFFIFFSASGRVRYQGGCLGVAAVWIYYVMLT